MIYRRKKLDADPQTDTQTDRQTDRQTDISGYRVASSLEEGATKKGRCYINVDFDINTQRIIFIFCYNLSDTYADYVTRIQGNHTSRLTML